MHMIHDIISLNYLFQNLSKPKECLVNFTVSVCSASNLLFKFLRVAYIHSVVTYLLSLPNNVVSRMFFWITIIYKIL